MAPQISVKYALRSYVFAAHTGNQSKAGVQGWADTQVGPYNVINCLSF